MFAVNTVSSGSSMTCSTHTPGRRLISRWGSLASRAWPVAERSADTAQLFEAIIRGPPTVHLTESGTTRSPSVTFPSSSRSRLFTHPGKRTARRSSSTPACTISTKRRSISACDVASVR